MADAKISDAINNLNESGLKIVLVINSNRQLEGTISDGDIRRGLLRGISLDSSIEDVIHRQALVASPEMGGDVVMQLMKINKIHQVPVVDSAHKVVGLHLWDSVPTWPARENLMVIMAGGKGVRLQPHTQDCPKPMLQIAGKPMLEHIINRAKLGGFNHFVISIHYLGHVIENYFGNGEGFGVRIDYLREKLPLGTAGALGLFDELPELPFLVTNGDVITDIKYGELLDFHERNSAIATMAVRPHEWQHPFGVVKMKGVAIDGFEEKPVYRSHINAGMYVLDPIALDFLPKGEYCDMPTLFESLRAKALPIVAYPMHEPWLDVGRPDDLKQANSQNKYQGAVSGAN